MTVYVTACVLTYSPASRTKQAKMALLARHLLRAKLSRLESRINFRTWDGVLSGEIDRVTVALEELGGGPR